MARLKRQNGTAPARRPAGLRLTLSAAGLALLGACAALGPPETTTSRAYQDVERQVLYERTVAALRASGLKVTASDPASGVVTADGGFAGRDWAECSEPRLFVEDSENRHYLVAVPDKNRRVALRAAVGEEPQGTTLTLASTFTAEPGSPMATTPTCRTTGALERQIFEAVAQAA